MWKGFYDSHVHWLETGFASQSNSLKGLQTPEEILGLRPEQLQQRGEWLVGAGWDFEPFPTRHILDEAFGERPVALYRVDHHALWVNTEALKRAEIGGPESSMKSPGGRVLMGEDHRPSGILLDAAMEPVLELLPQRTTSEVRAGLLKGQEVFSRAGFSRIRDLSGSALQWEASMDLAESGDLNLHVDQFFSAENPSDYMKALNLCAQARKEPHPEKLRPCGVKVYFDGALGSEGALLSQEYPSGSGRGLQLMTGAELQEIMGRVWARGFDLAVHAIGDEAAHMVATSACAVWEGQRGRLHLEHAQVLRPETIQLLRGRDVVCHLQPCHFLSDRKWLQEKLGSLYKCSFPWAALEGAGIPFFFGSDSPIERPSVADNQKALEEASCAGIALPRHPAEAYQREG